MKEDVFSLQLNCKLKCRRCPQKSSSQVRVLLSLFDRYRSSAEWPLRRASCKETEWGFSFCIRKIRVGSNCPHWLQSLFMRFADGCCPRSQYLRPTLADDSWFRLSLYWRETSLFFDTPFALYIRLMARLFFFVGLCRSDWGSFPRSTRRYGFFRLCICLLFVYIIVIKHIMSGFTPKNWNL